jgi:hypothetical protein
MQLLPRQQPAQFCGPHDGFPAHWPPLGGVGEQV